MATERTPKPAQPRNKRPRSRRGRKPAPAAPVVRRCLIDPDLPADHPLSAEEIADMKRHLRFVARYKAVLRPRLNAKEARMVDGSLEPEHRGTCLHLLSKIDRATILAALERDPLSTDAGLRARFLSSAAGISGDVGILLRFLEALCEAGQSEQATAAFTRAIDRIDFQAISAARMGRLLEVMQRAFPERELVGALFGLLRNPGFVAAFDTHAGELDPGIAARFVPLRAVHGAIFGRAGAPARTRELAAGLPIVLAVPPSMLTAYPQAVRERLLQAALDTEDDGILAHPGVEVLLGSLPETGEVAARHGLALARMRLARGQIEQARTLLTGLRRGPAGEQAGTLLGWLDKPMAGPLALEESEPDPDGGLQPAFHLRRLVSVWLRSVPARELGRLNAEREAQTSACLPAVAGILDHGRAGDRAFLVVEGAGQRLDRVLDERQHRLDIEEARALALAGVRLLRALALAGLVLPDLHPRRFLLPRPGAWEAVVLADLGGVQAREPAAAALEARLLAARWCHAALCFPPFRGKRLRRELGNAERRALDEALDRGADPVELASVLAAGR